MCTDGEAACSATSPSCGTRTAGAACTETANKDWVRNLEERSSRPGAEEAAPALPLVVAAGAGGCAGAARVPSQRVVHLLPQLLRRHLQEREMLHSGFNPLRCTKCPVFIF